MFVEAGMPGGVHAIARLQHGLAAPRPAAADEAEMAAMIAGEELQDHARLAMRAGAEHDTVIDPLHRRTMTGSRVRGKIRPKLTAGERFRQTVMCRPYQQVG